MASRGGSTPSWAQRRIILIAGAAHVPASAIARAHQSLPREAKPEEREEAGAR